MRILCLILFLGSALVLRAEPPSIPEELLSMQETYRVKHGDTLAQIANKHKVSVSFLLTINKNRLYDPNKIYIDQCINVPGPRAIELIEKQSEVLLPLMQSLGAEKYSDRKSAMLSFMDLDWKAVSILLGALKNKDPEIRENARTILREFHSRAAILR